MFGPLIEDLRIEVLYEGLAKELAKKNALAAQAQQQQAQVQAQARDEKAQAAAANKEQQAQDREKHTEKYTDRMDRKAAKTKDLHRELTQKKHRDTMSSALGAISRHSKHATSSETKSKSSKS